MSGELIAIVSVGVGLAILLVGLFAWLRSDMVKSEERLRQDIKQVEERGGRFEHGNGRPEVHRLLGEFQMEAVNIRSTRRINEQLIS